MKRDFRRQLVQGRFLAATIAKETVGRVFEEEKAVPVGELHDLLPLRSRARHACGILEIRDDVKELRHAPGERSLERLDIGAVGVDRDADHVRAVAAQQRERPVVRRCLRKDRVAALQHAQAKELNQLERSVAGEDAVGRHTLPLGEPLAQRLETKRRPILGMATPLF